MIPLRSCRGVALVLVLWSVFILSLCVMASSAIVRVSLDEESARQTSSRAKWIAESGAVIASHSAIKQTDERLHAAFGEGRFDVTWKGDGGRMNINAEIGRDDPASLRRLFTLWGLDTDSISRLMDALRDWVDADDLRRLNGAEKTDYEQQKRSGPANAPFRSTDDLASVLGWEMVAQAQPQWRDYFTIWGDGAIDIHSAPADILQACCDITSSQAASFFQKLAGPDGENDTPDDLRFKDMDAARIALGLSPAAFAQLAGRIKLESSLRRLVSLGKVGQRTHRIEAVVDVAPTPPKWLLWQE